MRSSFLTQIIVPGADGTITDDIPYIIHKFIFSLWGKLIK